MLTILCNYLFVSCIALAVAVSGLSQWKVPATLPECGYVVALSAVNLGSNITCAYNTVLTILCLQYCAYNTVLTILCNYLFVSCIALTDLILRLQQLVLYRKQTDRYTVL